MSKHVKLWAMNAFNEWRLFHGFNMAKSIVNLFENEGLIKDLVDMLSSFVLQVAKKYGSLYPPTKYNFLPFFEYLYNWVSFFKSCVFLVFVLSMLLQVMCFFLLLGLMFMLRF